MQKPAPVVNFVPVGHTTETLVESLRHHPISRIILILGDKPSTKPEKRAREIATEIKTALGTLPFQELEVDMDDITAAALQITEAMKHEKDAGNKLMVNLSGSLRSIGLAAYMAATAVKAECYVGLPEYKGDNITGVKQIVDVPLFPIKQIGTEKLKLLKALKEKSIGIDEIIEILKPKTTKKTKNYLSERSRISHHIKDLKNQKLIETQKEGKNIKIRLTQLGTIYLEGMEN